MHLYSLSAWSGPRCRVFDWSAHLFSNFFKTWAIVRDWPLDVSVCVRISSVRTRPFKFLFTSPSSKYHVVWYSTIRILIGREDAAIFQLKSEVSFHSTAYHCVEEVLKHCAKLFAILPFLVAHRKALTQEPYRVCCFLSFVKRDFWSTFFTNKIHAYLIPFDRDSQF